MDKLIRSLDRLRQNIAVVITLTVITATSADAAINPILPARINTVELVQFAPEDLKADILSLFKGVPSTALEKVHEETVKHPEDLASFIALIQAQPQMWQDGIDEFEGRLGEYTIRASQDTLTESEIRGRAYCQFKLGLLLYYQWGHQNTISNMEQLASATELVQNAWNSLKSPLIGLLLLEQMQTTAIFDRKHYTPNELPVYEEMISSLLGEDARTVYKKSKDGNWNDGPPSMQTAPANNTRLLSAVIKSLDQFLLRRTGHNVFKDGKSITEWEPRTEEREREIHYYETWSKTLDTSLGIQSPAAPQ